MTQEHPITPPPELVQQWMDTPHGLGLGCHRARSVPDAAYAKRLIEAAQWGADQQLLACGKYLEQCAAWEEEDVTEMYNYLRPHPPSLKEQALALLDKIKTRFAVAEEDVIRRALEQLE